MSFKIFYSWQSKTPTRYNKNFIETCLKDAIKQLKKELKTESPDFYLDRDTKDIPGRPNIPTTIDEKIRVCDVFVGDISYVAYIDTNQPQGKRSLIDKISGKNKWIQEGVYSTNVAEELGTANGALHGSDRIVTVMNLAYGTPDQLNFDSKQMRFPITYNYHEKTTEEDRQNEKKKLTDELKKRIRTIFDTLHERQKDYFYPFITWKTWETTYNRPFSFERTPYIENTFSEILENINNPKTVYRICGLSGIGKTRMLFECFNNMGTGETSGAINKILYIDVKEQDDKEVVKAVKELLIREENKILIIDNCTKELHVSIVPFITKENSSLSLISVSTNPEEKAHHLEAERITRLMILDNIECKPVVDKILITNFTEFREDEQKLLVEFSSGIPFMATLMAQNPERGSYQPGTLTQEDVVERLLGPLYKDPHSRSAIYACSLFSKFGFSDDLAYQSDKIAMNSDIFDINPDGINAEDVEEWKKNKFRQICTSLYDRQLLEKKGRTYSFRPSPLAVRMAEDWWRSCTVTKFQRILPVLQGAGLVEFFCEQFRYLKHVENARLIVQNLCDDFFSKAEVLNTEVGSRLFRSFVYVNPESSSKALSEAFLSLQRQDLIKIKEGRRNLVWALEQLCFRKGTFTESTKVMAAFSIGENENIANNATNQFLQLFHIHLPGTEANLEDRWDMITYCLNGGEEYESLGISALSSSLTADNFSRMGGAEDQGDVAPLQDYRPNGREVYEYWQKSISELEKYCWGEGPFSERSINILKDKFYSLCAHGGGKLIIPVISKLIETGNYDRMEARSRIQLMLNAPRVYDEYTAIELQRLFDELTPETFSERFHSLVAKPSTEEYFERGSRKNIREILATKIEKLADEFLSEKDRWFELATNFYVPHLAEGYNFGKAIAQMISGESVENLVEILVKLLKEAAPENKNIAVLLGIISNYPNHQLTIHQFRNFLNDDELYRISFTIARNVELPHEELLRLLEYAKNERLPSSIFSEFTYGWGVKHLNPKDAEQILKYIGELDSEGPAVAFYIIATWIGNDRALFDQFRGYIRETILQNSQIILDKITASMDVFYYAEIVSKLLEKDNEEIVARKVMTIIIEQANRVEYYYSKKNSFYTILQLLQEKYFRILWEALSTVYLNISEYGWAATHFKDLLGSHHDYDFQSEGLLFSGDSNKFETIFQWCKNHRGIELYWIAELLPMFNSDRDTRSAWHPYAMAFIDEFGDDKNVLNAISAKLGSYSWVGSVVPKLESDASLFEQLLNHKIESVRKWAHANLEDVQNRIRWERNRDEDGVF